MVVEFDRTEDCQMAYKTLGKKAREENSGWEYNLLGKKIFRKKVENNTFFQEAVETHGDNIRRKRQKSWLICVMGDMIRQRSSTQVLMSGNFSSFFLEKVQFITKIGSDRPK